jgi:SAM-dependent methyltransferase
MRGRPDLGEVSELLFRAPIRAGQPGVTTSESVEVRRCTEYDVAFLGAKAPTVDYESDEYRSAYDGSAEVETYVALHDDSLRRYLRLLDGVPLGGRVIADFGCGPGSFLNLVREVAALTIGIEPHRRFREAAAARGHRVYAYGADFLRDSGEATVDVAVGLHVIEHVESPRDYLAEICRSLRPGGTVLVVTPNLHDFLLELVGEPYRRFFFRTAHRWYFSGAGLARLAGEAGLDEVRTGYLQEYDLGNAFSWLRDGEPRGNGTMPALGAALERAWTANLEDAGTANVVYVLGRKSPSGGPA